MGKKGYGSCINRTLFSSFALLHRPMSAGAAMLSRITMTGSFRTSRVFGASQTLGILRPAFFRIPSAVLRNTFARGCVILLLPGFLRTLLLMVVLFRLLRLSFLLIGPLAVPQFLRRRLLPRLLLGFLFFLLRLGILVALRFTFRLHNRQIARVLRVFVSGTILALPLLTLSLCGQFLF